MRASEFLDPTNGFGGPDEARVHCGLLAEVLVPSDLRQHLLPNLPVERDPTGVFSEQEKLLRVGLMPIERVPGVKVVVGPLELRPAQLTTRALSDEGVMGVKVVQQFLLGWSFRHAELLLAIPRMMSSRLAAASWERRSGIVFRRRCHVTATDVHIDGTNCGRVFSTTSRDILTEPGVLLLQSCVEGSLCPRRDVAASSVDEHARRRPYSVARCDEC